MNKINLLGVTFESINTAIFLASSDWQVSFIADKADIEKVLTFYQFDRQLALLWQLYLAENKIIIQNEVNFNDNFWLFYDENSHFNTDFELKPTSQILLSGAKEIGFFDTLANQFSTNWVYYLPFNFLKDGNNFNAFFNIELLLVGEKIKDSHSNNLILKSLIKNSQKHAFNNIKTTELIRASIHAMLATRLSFINEMARLADSLNVNIEQVQNAMGMDSRIGGQYLKAGWGFGGKSLPNELNFLMQKFNDNKVDTHILQAVSDINDDQKELIFRKFWQYFDGNIDNKSVMIWGAGYRTGAGRTVGSAIHSLLKLCWNYQIKTYVYVVNTSNELTEIYGDEPLLQIMDNPYDELKNCHSLFILNWDNQAIDINHLNQVALPIFDAKNVLKDDEILQLTSFYTGIGKSK